MLWLLLMAPASAEDLGFSEGLAPLDVHVADRSAASCGRCHEREYEDWSSSRHRVAHTNALYQVGLIDEPSPFCVNCHSPAADQVVEVLANLPWYASQDPRRGGAPPPKKPEPLAEEGVSCVACHVRDGTVLSSVEPSPWATHRTKQSETLNSSELCRGCHEFRMPHFVDGGFTLIDVPMQSTWSEWRTWSDAGGEGTCQSCHMPGGRHLFAGAHDRAALADSVEVQAARDGGLVRFTIASVDVGHHLPTGDLFRNLTLEVAVGDDWTVIDRIGRRFVAYTADGPKRLAEDTSLRPGQPRHVDHAQSTPVRWRLRYHYGADHDEVRGLLTDAQLYEVVAEGEA